MVLSSFCEQPVSLTENGHARGRRNSVISRNFSCPGKRRKNKSLIVEKFRMATPYSMDTSERAITRKGSGRTSQVTGARPNMTARVSCVSDPSRRCWRLEIPQTKTYSGVVAVLLPLLLSWLLLLPCWLAFLLFLLSLWCCCRGGGCRCACCCCLVFSFVAVLSLSW